MNLAGTKILVTRPVHQADNLCRLIADNGGQAIRLPVIEIVEFENNQDLLNCRNQLAQLDIIIFISANAVQKTLAILLKQQKLPAHIQVIAVGKQTAKVLKDWGLTPLCSKSPFNSEMVLEMPLLQTPIVQAKRINIFRGEGGRELLADKLRQRGATVNYINVYKRICPPPLIGINELQADIITITSVESLHNLLTILKAKKWLDNTPLVVMSQRIREEANKLGLSANIFVASNASDFGLLFAIEQAIEHS